MKKIILFITILIATNSTASAQFKETVQFATLTPTAFVLESSVRDEFKIHYVVSTSVYFATYMITESQWKAALITLFLGAAKELIYDDVFNQGDPRFDAMGWNTLGVAQGAVFTLSLKL